MIGTVGLISARSISIRIRVSISILRSFVWFLQITYFRVFSIKNSVIKMLEQQFAYFAQIHQFELLFQHFTLFFINDENTW